MNGKREHKAPVLQIIDLTKRYGSLLAVDRLSLEINEGEVFGILGPNGAGKTTTIRMICGLLKPDSGRVFIQGEEWHQQRDNRYRVGLCYQENILWHKLICYEQLVFQAEIYGLPGRQARQRALGLLEKMGLREKRNKLASTLSGGLRRRLSICMAVVHDPDILVFDEPEAGLDPQSRILVREYMLELARDKTVILTTHNMDEAEKVATRVAIIDHGRLLTVDTPEKLRKSTGSGDILRIDLPADPDMIRKAEQLLAPLVGPVIAAGNTLVLRSKDIVEKIPAIASVLKDHGISAGEMRLRENSLEDVFIHLTGKMLRD